MKVKIIIMLVALIATSFNVKAQSEGQDSLLAGLTPEQKQGLNASLLENYKKNQVKSIAGVAFGSSREKVESVMTNKYGTPYALWSRPDRLVYKNIKYAGYDFDSVYFLFQSDGVNTFFNGCVFVMDAEDIQDAKEKENKLGNVLSQRYSLMVPFVDTEGNPIHFGGVSPLWNGDLETVVDYLSAVHTDIKEVSDDMVASLRKSYYVRIIYGPYNYVKEEF